MYLESTELSRSVSDNEFRAPATDGDNGSLLEVWRETDRGVLDEIHDMEERVCGASLQIKVITHPHSLVESSTLLILYTRLHTVHSFNCRKMFDIVV